MDTLAIVKRIEMRLTEIGMSKSDFYKRSGISSASFSQWSTGKYNPSQTKLNKAAEVLGLDQDYLCFGIKKNSPPSRPEPTEREARILDALRSKSPAEQKALLTLLGISED